MNQKMRSSRRKLQKMRQSCRKARNRIANVIHNRYDIGLRHFDILFPGGKRLVQIKYRFVSSKAQLIEEWDR